MGGFLGIGGSSAKTDRSTTLQGYGGLEDIFSRGIPAASDAISQSLGYYTKLLSGNRPAIQQAAAPSVNAATATSDAAKRSLNASGTARGGGTAATNQTRQSDVMTRVNNAMFGAIDKAAGEEGKEGQGLLNTSEQAASDLTNASIKSRPESNSENLSMQQRVVSGIQALFGSIF